MNEERQIIKINLTNSKLNKNGRNLNRRRTGISSLKLVDNLVSLKTTSPVKIEFRSKPFQLLKTPFPLLSSLTSRYASNNSNSLINNLCLSKNSFRKFTKAATLPKININISNSKNSNCEDAKAKESLDTLIKKGKNNNHEKYFKIPKDLEFEGTENNNYKYCISENTNKVLKNENSRNPIKIAFEDNYTRNAYKIYNSVYIKNKYNLNNISSHAKILEKRKQTTISKKNKNFNINFKNLESENLKMNKDTNNNCFHKLDCLSENFKKSNNFFITSRRQNFTTR